MAERVRRRAGRLSAVALVLLITGSACTSPTGQAATNDDWRQDLIDTSHRPDEAAFCTVLGTRVPGREPRTVVILDAEIDTAEIDEVATFVEQVSGTEPRRLTKDEVQQEVTELFAAIPGMVGPSTIDALGARLEVPPLPEHQADRIRERPGVENVVVVPPGPATGTAATVIGTIEALWPSRFVGTDLILFVRPERGDEPLEEIEAAIRRDHPDAVQSIELVSQQQALAEFDELFREDQNQIDSVSAAMLPASVRILATSMDGVDAIDEDYRDDPRINEIVRAQSGFLLMQQVGALLTEDLPGREGDALTELARTAPDALRPDVHALIRAFPAPDALAASRVVVGPGDDAAISRERWEETVPAADRLRDFAVETCGLRRT